MAEARTLLVELLTEELPPKALRPLSEAFAASVFSELQKGGFLEPQAAARPLATPRRLAVLINAVRGRSPDFEREMQGPSTAAPEQAIAGFARKSGVEVQALQRQRGPKGEVFVARVKTRGRALGEVLSESVGAALRSLPVPKIMRWGAGEAQFVRPVHALVMLHGDEVVRGEVLGLSAGRTTRGHRFLGASSIELQSADEYEKKLLDEGHVLADFAKRKDEIERQLGVEARRQGASLGDYQNLLDEVTALVEHPSIYVAGFDPVFLEVPQECLILTMRQNQKYFPLFDGAGKLLPRFLIVSNMAVADPRHIVAGNERVVRPRLEDARFFFNQDRKSRLEGRVPELGRVVYHNKLGTQLERVQRLKLLSGYIARKLGADVLQTERAAELAKADLLTGMVGEFPELQGIMGRYYALHDGEPAAVADAIEAHYRPRFAGDALPDGPVAGAVALADKLDAIAGLFSIGQHPTGDKDPFGLRRAALGIVRILVEKRLPLSLVELAAAAFTPFAKQAPDELMTFIYDRFAGYLKELGFTTLQVEAVLEQRPARLDLVPQQLEAVKAFQALPEAESLAAANKRVANILRQAAAKGEAIGTADRAALKEAAELALFDALDTAAQSANRLYERGDYAGYLKTFAILKAPVDAFFDQVMVMAEDRRLRSSRLGLLSELRSAMNRIADISRLAV